MSKELEARMDRLAESLHGKAGDQRRRTDVLENRLDDVVRRLTAVENVVNERPTVSFAPLDPAVIEEVTERARQERKAEQGFDALMDDFEAAVSKEVEERRVREIVTGQAAAFGEACRQRFVELCEEVGLLGKDGGQ